jgi:hypothetical protein
MEIYFVG